MHFLMYPMGHIQSKPMHFLMYPMEWMDGMDGMAIALFYVPYGTHQTGLLSLALAAPITTCFPLAHTIGIVAITHNNLHHVHGHKGPPGGEYLSPIAD